MIIQNHNLKKKIFYIINIFADENIKDYKRSYSEIKSELNLLIIQSKIKKKYYKKFNIQKNIKVK